jgi:hypothetical protein
MEIERDECRGERHLSHLDLGDTRSRPRLRPSMVPWRVTAGQRVLRSTRQAVGREPDRLARMLCAAPAS